ncbi:MAG TPA: aldehyde dehydrogenase family protein [Solirubrobacteraceae bacterium]|nr:aldehyde dehydrogenase family protein [Solirubrobacteraceae bacterium]
MQPTWTQARERAGERLEVRDPATGELLETIPAGAAADADAAVGAARAAFAGWRETAPADRAAALKAAARALRERLDAIAELQTRENGKPLADSRGGVEAGIGAIEQYAELGPLHRGGRLAGGWSATDEMVHEPRGVVVLLVPWNDPVAIACGQIAAALVTGNTVVFKPSEKTPLSGALVADILAEHLPAGVLNLVLGDGRAGRALVAHPDVDLIMHTGSVATGREIAKVAAGTAKKVLLELGGKDALIVDAGVDPEWAAEQAAIGAFANAGQICTSVERIYVHESIAEPFVSALTRRAEELTVGPGLDPDSEMGPLIDDGQRDLVDEHVREAVRDGAEIRTGGRTLGERGSFYAPTVLTGVRDEMRIMREETFGPVAAVRAVASFDEALAAANEGEYGLAATVLTADDEHARRAARELDVGTVKVNAVFGGAPGGAAQPRRASGTGFGYGPELLDELTVTKVVHRAHAVPARPAS